MGGVSICIINILAALFSIGSVGCHKWRGPIFMPKVAAGAGSWWWEMAHVFI